LVHSHFVPHAKREIAAPEHLAGGGLEVQNAQLGDDRSHQVLAKIFFCHGVSIAMVSPLKGVAARSRAEQPYHLVPRIAAREEGVPAIFGGVVSISS
jgi:hypothetical protein